MNECKIKPRLKADTLDFSSFEFKFAHFATDLFLVTTQLKDRPFYSLFYSHTMSQDFRSAQMLISRLIFTLRTMKD